APWNAAAANLDFKWTRISLKSNNMTPVPVNGDSTNSRQVCWDGAHEIILPAGYDSTCGPNGSISAISLTNGATGYPSLPTVPIDAPPAGGTQATAGATITQVTNGQVASVAVTSGGYYTSAPAVSFTGGGGTGAAGTAVWTAPGASVDTLSLAN